MLTHSSTRSHKCRFCHRPFARKAHMLRHELIHFGDKPYKCKFCDYTSTRSDKLKEHLQKVHGVANPKIEQERAPQAPEPINYVEVSEVPISSSGIILNATPVSSTIAFKVEDELSGEML
ncbi:c2H2-type zinc-finger domain-containing protein [Ditylenchus destructor]|uniref:C2H2-type zinc-finger domain-containing protein n=1 Tax=Ditylenchus destructor TaxID=166010 RepID=A0AAD4MPX3_9BILA|nr:c2H2-type zinc-finger domain-containing protein [Ditylenchus destructor]